MPRPAHSSPLLGVATLARSALAAGLAFAVAAAVAPHLRASPILDCPAGQTGDVEIVFSPRPPDAGLRAVERVIDSARRSIDMAAYEFTSKPVADALRRAKTRGVAIRILADERSNRDAARSQAPQLAREGVAVRYNGAYAIMHDKFLVADIETVQTGSLNFTYSAERRNAENILVLWRSPCAAQIYAGQFETLWDEGRP